jgi:hypothetical protein
MRRVLLLAPLAFMLAACGGGGKSASSSGNPLVDAAKATAAAESEKDATTGTVSYGTSKLLLNGQGGYNHTTDEGWQHLVLTVPGVGRPSLDEIFVKNVLWMKSPLFSRTLPKGKEWVKVDLEQAGKNLGFDFKALMGQTPADALTELERTSTPVTKIGTETIAGVETTHYRAAIDPRKIPAADTFQKLTAAAYKPIDVWVAKDGRVAQVRFDYTAKVDPAKPQRARVLLTMKLSDFGETVDVAPPAPGLVVDAAAPVGSTG